MPLPLTPETRLAEHRDAQVELRCLRCGHSREMSAEALARLIGWQTLLVNRLGQFRCSCCGARRVAIAFGYDRKPRGWLSNH